MASVSNDKQNDRQEETDPLRSTVVPYLIGLIVPAAALVVGLLLGYLKARDAIAGLGIVIAIVLLSVGSSHLYLSRSRQRYDRVLQRSRTDQNEILQSSIEKHDKAMVVESSRFHELVLEFQRELFQILATPIGHAASATQDGVSASIGVIDESRMIDIETTSREVWIYAFDLKWDAEDNSMARLINNGLADGRRYKVLIPPYDEVRSRAKALANRNGNVPSLDSLLKFRARKVEQKFQQFVVNIYHPKSVDSIDTESNDPIVVLQPRWDVGHGERTPMLLVRGQSAKEYEREFRDAWDDGAAIPMDELIRDPTDG